jgi:predicted amidophosphoribosyltransferase
VKWDNSLPGSHAGFSPQVTVEGRLGPCTEPQRTCPSCGNEFSGAMEFCPVCMLRNALANGVESGESSASEATVKPTTSEQAVQRFFRAL